MAANRNLHQAKSNKKDEFYTQLVDIENELRHYTDHFRGKVVYCNCDDPRVSNFFHYFAYNFRVLGLKKLVTTCYKNQQMDMFSQHDAEKAIWLEYDGTENETGVPSAEDIGIHYLEGDGDFRSAECIELLMGADIVVTNPPFSLFREYVAQLIEYDKKFLIVGNKNAITKREIFPLIRDNRMWIGNTPMSRDMLFDIPEDYAQELIATKKEGSGYKLIDGVIKGRSPSIWFTNLHHAKRNEDLILFKRYSPDEYPAYFNLDAIEVSKVKDIPYDYYGMMGVPISFMDKYNPQQFQIIGWAQGTLGKEIGVKPWTPKHRKHRREVEKKIPIDGNIYMVIDGRIVEPYARIIIKRKRIQA